MNCEHCGAENSESAAYCRLCFTSFNKVQAAETVQSSLEPAARPDSGQPPSPVPGLTEEEMRFRKYLETGKPVRPENNVAKMLKFGLYAMVVLLAVAGILFSYTRLQGYAPALKQANEMKKAAPSQAGETPSQAPLSPLDMESAARAPAMAALRTAAMAIMAYGAENDGDFSSLTADDLNRRYNPGKKFKEGQPGEGDMDSVFIEEKYEDSFVLSVIDGSGKVYKASGNSAGQLTITE